MGEPGCLRSVSSRSGSAEVGSWSSHQAAILLDHKFPFLCFPQKAPSNLYFVWQLLVAYPNPFLPFTLLIKCLYYCGPQWTSWNTVFPSLSCSEVWLMPKSFWPLRWEHEFVGRDFLGGSLKEGGKARERHFWVFPLSILLARTWICWLKLQQPSWTLRWLARDKPCTRLVQQEDARSLGFHKFCGAATLP